MYNHIYIYISYCTLIRHGVMESWSHGVCPSGFNPKCCQAKGAEAKDEEAIRQRQWDGVLDQLAFLPDLSSLSSKIF